MFDKMVQKPESLSFVFHHAIVTNDRDIGFFEVLLTSPQKKILSEPVVPQAT